MSLKEFTKYGGAAESLSRAIRQNKVSHAYIIEGDRLTDKPGFGKAFAQAICCTIKPGEGCGVCRTCRGIEQEFYEDFYSVAADGRSVRDAAIDALQRDLLNSPVGEAGRNIALIQDADTMTPRAMNHLLKTLEEPAPGTVILLLSENSEKLLPTIRSRCLKVRLQAPPAAGPQADKAMELLQDTLNGTVFTVIAKKIDQDVKSAQEAALLLEALEQIAERRLQAYFLPYGGQTSTLLSLETARALIPLLEEAKRAVESNINYKYTLKDLFLRIGSGGIKW